MADKPFNMATRYFTIFPDDIIPVGTVSGDCILILHVFLCGVCSWWSECERMQLCVMCWEAVVIVGVI